MALIALGACGGQKAAGDPPVSSPPTASAPASASPSPPEMPALAKEHTKAGAEAFVRYFWEVVNYSQQSLDTTSLATLADPFCEGCRSGSSWIEGLRSSGGRIEGGQNVVGRLTISSVGQNLMLAEVVVSHSDQKIVGGSSPTAYAASSVSYRMLLMADPDGWRVDRLETQQ